MVFQSVDTDPGNFDIQLFSPDDPNNPINVAQSVSTPDNPYTYNPSSPLKAEQGWRINFVATNGGILAQSGYFQVQDGGS